MRPLFNLVNVFTPILAFFVLREVIPKQNLAWIALIISAGFLVVYDEGFKLRSQFNKNIAYYLIWVLCLSVTRIAANRGINALGFWNFTFYEFFYGSTMLLFFIPFIQKNINLNVEPILFMIPAVALEFFGLLIILRVFAYQVVIPSIINSIPLASLAAFVLSRFDKRLLGVHPLKTYAVRFSGAFLMTAGLIKLALNA